MKTDRRHFLSASAAGTLASSARGAETVNDRYRKLDGILQSPVLKKQLFKTPVIIQSVELLRLENRYICRVRSKDGAEGIAVAHTGMSTFFPIFLRNVQPFLIGKDARELDMILEKIFIYQFNFRLSGMALGLPVSTSPSPGRFGADPPRRRACRPGGRRRRRRRLRS